MTLLEHKTWRALSESQDGPARDQFTRLSESDQRLHWLFYESRINDLEIAVYAEIYFNHDARRVHGLGSFFSKFKGTVPVDVKALQAAPIVVEHGHSPGLLLTCRGDLEFECKIAYTLDADERWWSLKRATARMDAKASWSGTEQNLGRWTREYWRDPQRNARPEMASITCPTCFGEGSSPSFAIPKAEMESGLTGYALFGANTVNAVEACPRCGGQGTRYEKWYLRELPGLARSGVRFRKGSGRISCAVMAPTQQLVLAR